MRAFSLCALALLAACDAAPAPQAESPGPRPVPGPIARPAPPRAPVARAVTIADKTDLLDFAYEWPAEAAAIPQLDARFRAEARADRRSALKTARADRDARAPDFPPLRHDLTRAWTVEGAAAGLLALRGEFYVFTGGAHGMSGFESILWDRGAGREIAPLSLFTDRAKAAALMTAIFCDRLDAMRAERRGGPVEPGGSFSDCPKLADQVLIPSDARDGAFTGFRVLVGPYEAGPYAEGTYEVPLPVTPELVALLAPQRKAALKRPL